MNFKSTLLALVAVASLTTGCFSSKAYFNPIETRTTKNIVKLKMHSTLVEQGSHLTSSAGLNLDTFRANVMNSSSIRFVEANEDASLYISYTPVTEIPFSWINFFVGTKVEQGYTVRITENTGKVIYIVAGRVTAPIKNQTQLAYEMNRIFVQRVIPVLEGQAPVDED